MLKSQKPLYDKIKHFVKTTQPSSGSKLIFDTSQMPARDRAFILKLAKELGLENGYMEKPVVVNQQQQRKSELTSD